MKVLLPWSMRRGISARSISSKASANRKLGFEKVRTRIAFEGRADTVPDRDAEMNTRAWIDEEGEDNQYRILSTLNPAYLQSSDYISLSRSSHPTVAFLPRTRSVTLTFFKKDTVHQPFPLGTRGFLYYHAPRYLPPMAGGVRFRVTPRGHPDSFPDGHDLLHGALPWEISLPSIAAAVGHKEVLREQLLNEGLVTQTDLDTCRALTPNKKRLDYKLTLYSLGQPFPVAFNQGMYVWIAGQAEIKPWVYACMFADMRARFRPRTFPYTGSALAQFELSRLPEHAGSDTVVMRIVKMLTPPTCVLPDYDHAIPAPVEGELVWRPMGRARASRLQPWYCDVAADPSASAAALRMLVENSRVQNQALRRTG
ncbi:hypothetical protein DFH06DRAFT_1252986 [Mycena polygramma]|nr:hypothetical protein DFH06DRAFT_1252986 [Mycena polygramma]